MRDVTRVMPDCGVSHSPICPYFRRDDSCCSAARRDLGPRRPWEAERCRGEDHDSCPLFLSRVLLALRPCPTPGARDLALK